MAKGKHYVGPTTLDTATDPDDTTLLAAQGAGDRGYLKILIVNVSTAQASSSIAIEDGVGGAVVARVASTSVGTTVVFQFDDMEEGVRLSENTALNATIEGATGVVANVYAVVDVR